jgi:RimJ/RimL family protein N-acetyltransferase
MSKNTIELNAIGSKVKLEDDVIGTIIGIHINHNNVSYEIGWWNGRSYSKDHFSTYQFTPTSDEKTRIGFA